MVYTLLYEFPYHAVLLAELDALEGILVLIRVRLCVCRRIQLELAFIFFPEVLTAVSRSAVFSICSGIDLLFHSSGSRYFGGLLCCRRFRRCLGLRLCRGGSVRCGVRRRFLCGVFLFIFRQAAQRLHMAAVQVEHIRLEAGHFQAHPVVLALLGQLFLVCLVDDLVRAVTGFLQQLVGITEDIITACKIELNNWYKLRIQDELDDPFIGWERKAILEIFNDFDYFKLKGGAIRLDDRIIAFTFGEALNADTAVIHVEKADPNIRGAYPAINQGFVEHAWSAMTYINREEDMGHEGLRKAKESYKPFKMIEKFNARRK